MYCDAYAFHDGRQAVRDIPQTAHHGPRAQREVPLIANPFADPLHGNELIAVHRDDTGDNVRSILDRRGDVGREGGRVAPAAAATHLDFRLVFRSHQGMVRQIEHLAPMHGDGGVGDRGYSSFVRQHGLSVRFTLGG